MWKARWFMVAALSSGCTSEDPAANFAGSWAYEAGSTATVVCGGMSSSVPFDTVVETFVESNGLLVKHDSQGCMGLEFMISGNMASHSHTARG